MASERLYLEHFGFSERPFTLLPDPDLLFWSSQHRKAFDVMQYGLFTRSPVTLLTGEIGAGKTTLVQTLLRQMDDGVTVGLISNAQGGRHDLLRWVLRAFDLPLEPHADYVTVFHAFQDFMLAEYAAGRRVLLIVDEAQNLSQEGLEEVRMLTNINSGKDELLQLLLVGQPELRDTVRHPNMRQLAQRITAAIHLQALTADETSDYIHHRLTNVGGTGTEIAASAIAMIHEHAGGIPRILNQLCDLALLYAWGQDQTSATAEDVQSVMESDVFLRSTDQETRP
ncbi:ExeA family protein [Aestuariibius sp. HNIBRBA575]|uniref:ExeA family protein n=1 Tax=Aestuariibius sp. HNIBRBA575 TaxID=3233343 RepID=UPI0034A57804